MPQSQYSELEVFIWIFHGAANSSMRNYFCNKVVKQIDISTAVVPLNFLMFLSWCMLIFQDFVNTNQKKTGINLFFLPR